MTGGGHGVSGMQAQQEERGSQVVPEMVIHASMEPWLLQAQRPSGGRTSGAGGTSSSASRCRRLGGAGAAAGGSSMSGCPDADKGAVLGGFVRGAWAAAIRCGASSARHGVSVQVDRARNKADRD